MGEEELEEEEEEGRTGKAEPQDQTFLRGDIGRSGQRALAGSPCYKQQ